MIAKRPLAIVAALMVVGAALRAYRLDTALWYDEIVSLVQSVRPPLASILTHFPGNNDHPLYSVLAHLSVQVFGESPWTVRLPSAAFGVAAIPALYFVGTTVTTKLESLLAASILTVSYHHIWFSQNARGYTMLLLFVLLSTYFLVRWLADGRASHLVWYTISCALGSYTHLTMIPIVVTQCVVCGGALLGRRAGHVEWARALMSYAAAGGLTVALYAPMLLDVHEFFTTQTTQSNEVATPLWALMATLQGLQIGLGALWGLAIGLVILGAGVWSYLKESPAALLLFGLPVPVTLALALAAQRPIFPRFVFFAVGFALLIAVRGAAVVGASMAGWIPSRFDRRRAAELAAVALSVAAIAASVRSLPYGYRFPKQDYAQAVAFVEDRRAEADPIALATVTAGFPIQQYFGKTWPQIDSGAELLRLREQGRDTWVIFTFPAYIASGQKDLWAVLNQDCVEMASFEGTVAGGTIKVARCGPVKT